MQCMQFEWLQPDTDRRSTGHRELSACIVVPAVRPSGLPGSSSSHHSKHRWDPNDCESSRFCECAGCACGHSPSAGSTSDQRSDPIRFDSIGRPPPPILMPSQSMHTRWISATKRRTRVTMDDSMSAYRHSDSDQMGAAGPRSFRFNGSIIPSLFELVAACHSQWDDGVVRASFDWPIHPPPT